MEIKVLKYLEKMVYFLKEMAYFQTLNESSKGVFIRIVTIVIINNGYFACWYYQTL